MTAPGRALGVALGAALSLALLGACAMRYGRDGAEYRITGRRLVSKTHCCTPPEPHRPEPGSISVYRDGEYLAAVQGERLLVVATRDDGAFELFLPRGTWCLSATPALVCDRRVVVEGPADDVDIRLQVRAGDVGDPDLLPRSIELPGG